MSQPENLVKYIMGNYEAWFEEGDEVPEGWVNVSTKKVFVEYDDYINEFHITGNPLDVDCGNLREETIRKFGFGTEVIYEEFQGTLKVLVEIALEQDKDESELSELGRTCYDVDWRYLTGVIFAIEENPDIFPKLTKRCVDEVLNELGHPTYKELIKFKTKDYFGGSK